MRLENEVRLSEILSSMPIVSPFAAQKLAQGFGAVVRRARGRGLGDAGGVRRRIGGHWIVFRIN